MQELTDYVRDVAASLEALEGDADAATDWLGGTLEIVGHYERHYGHEREPELVAVEALVTYGGPTVRVRADGSSTLTVTGTWGSAAVTVAVNAPTVAAVMIGYAEGWQ